MQRQLVEKQPQRDTLPPCRRMREETIIFRLGPPAEKIRLVFLGMADVTIGKNFDRVLCLFAKSSKTNWETNLNKCSCLLFPCRVSQRHPNQERESFQRSPGICLISKFPCPLHTATAESADNSFTLMERVAIPNGSSRKCVNSKQVFGGRLNRYWDE